MQSAFLNPENVLDEIELRDDMVAAEFGCGSGGFTIPLAKRLEGGRVYALDIQEEAISALKGKAEMAGLANIEIRRCNIEAPEGSTLPANSLDLVLMPNVLFQVDDKEQVLKEAKRVLREGGKILIIDWLPKSRLGPKEGRISPDELKRIAQSLGLKLEKEFEAGRYHYGLVFTINHNLKS